MKNLLALCLLVMQVAICSAQKPAQLANPTSESKVLYIVADSCDFYYSSFAFESSKHDNQASYHTLNIPTKNGTFAIGCEERWLVANGKLYWPIDRLFPKSDLDKMPVIRMKDFAKDKSTKQLQRAYEKWQKEYDYVFVTKCYNPDNDQQERILAVDSYIYKPSKVRYPHYPADSLTNAIERGVRIIVIDSNKPYAKRFVPDKTSLTYAYGIFATQFGYEIVDRNGKQEKNKWLTTHENLNAPDEINIFTVDRNSLDLESDVVLDLSQFAETHDIKDVWSQHHNFSKGHITYFIDRAEITKNTMTVRTCNTLIITTGGFGGIRKKSNKTK
ncbi:MAG: hypothetical protein IKT94_04730 [Rikenellaceae bacterium]|nr:hypothetical protein [Rikenellaceae bacterium]